MVVIAQPKHAQLARTLIITNTATPTVRPERGGGGVARAINDPKDQGLLCPGY